ncbi:MAG: superoxide dismutase [Candidatus Riflebacteria bacterium]|nr:superoxide dismutase [Candidatus Riflebacteria bacterium]
MSSRRDRTISRRALLATAAAGSVALLGGGAGPAEVHAGDKGSKGGPFELEPLPYAKNALEPHLSARTLEFHHDKHHAGYVKKLNELIAGTDLVSQPLEKIVVAVSRDARKPIFNNAAQTFNHAFFWKSMKANGGGQPSGELARRMAASFGSFEEFKKRFHAAAVGLFGSGWVWLVTTGKALEIRATSNADTPLTEGVKSLVTLDVWEHAYYLDYQNRRADYVSRFLDHLVDWDFAARNLGA